MPKLVMHKDSLGHILAPSPPGQRQGVGRGISRPDVP